MGAPGALAWKIHETLPDAGLRLECPISIERATAHVDVVVNHPTGRLAIELKYKTRAITVDVGGEQFRVASHGAEE